MLEVPPSVDTEVLFCSPELDALQVLWEMFEADDTTRGRWKSFTAAWLH